MHVCACGAVRLRGESASMCCANGQVWNPSFHVQGQVCHLIGSLMPLPYFIASEVEETSTRMHITSGLKQNIVHELSVMFHHENQYVRHFKTARELFLSNATNEGWKVVIYE